MIHLLCNIKSTQGGDQMIRLNLSNFIKLQDNMTEIEMAEKLHISRSQLWRIKKKNSSAGESFISKFKKAYPNEPFEDYFFVESVELNQQVDLMEQLCERS